ncbi:DUF998 domain-containing protein [Streptosporangium roseum]|uniref:DUF998 domain-containing protein n=1 Tax=Streptosporangium roseum (strain ATCC 12428 / DSM 43021 / JCM 3005 / KCTC 9067 / NCIMB 10171 / NRRL 2505 / NI 9100) TaxID=479432 RepID=D2AR63_STRRD|nr:DUF998 domain-containing protein [Streptosporangium roseum]ACZ88404.1 conserved hypothetical protein [Streptosporangium roseum DSM 43021]
MTHTINPSTAPITTATTTRPAARLLLGCGIAAGPLFLAVGVIQGLTREGFDFTRNAISQLSLGDLGWIQVTNFVITGALLIAGAIGTRRALHGGPGGTWAPRLVAVFGASFLVSAVFAADPGAGFPIGTPEGPTGSISTNGAVHMFGGMIGYLALCAAFVVLARRFSAQGRRGWAVASRIVPVAVLAGFAGSAASVLAFSAGAALGLVWLTATTARLATTPPTGR